MRPHLAILLILLCPALNAQAPDWLPIEELPPGTNLIVTTRHPLRCTLDFASDEGIACATPYGGLWIDRARIAEISLSRQAPAVLLGTAVGAAAGGALAGSANSSDDAGKPARVLAGMALGGFVGFLVTHVAFSHAQGAVLYQRP